ncbi:hypothetical protein FNV62_52380 [Streptomyces sp. RLB3-17]|nr:hypothetical protein FNV58_54005 [Streptomyces sp. RLB1-9]QDO25331.1 hypothetical protein FNV65_52580 [Streptomyces sp. S1A1-8]QDO35452.1 hypothetical protein FNV63_52605 [Streptomyces sp. S1A1-3]QDO45469.1 hypothetical protein FNV62_52380 [Streptomyces sp. RLB3-17]
MTSPSSSIGGRAPYAPLDLRPDDTFSRFLFGRGLFWARMEKGFLSILPQWDALGCCPGCLDQSRFPSCELVAQVGAMASIGSLRAPRKQDDHE